MFRRTPGAAFSCMMPLLSGIITRTTYPGAAERVSGALKHLITRSARASPMVANISWRVTLLLLDELLDPNTLYQPTATDAYRDELRAVLLAMPKRTKSSEAGRRWRQFKQGADAAAWRRRTLPERCR